MWRFKADIARQRPSKLNYKTIGKAYISEKHRKLDFNEQI
jgi:hypothetical protein